MTKNCLITLEVNSFNLGRCYTVCNVRLWAKKFGPILHLKKEFDVRVFVHTDGDEFWLNGISEFPFEIPSFIMETSNTKNIAATTVSLTEVESYFLNKDELQCKTYSLGDYLQ